MSLRDKMLAVMADVNVSVSEREELVELIAIALLTRKNLFILGDPGQAKSYAINAFRSRITGAKQFERLLSKQTDEEQLFGRLDLSSLIPGSVPESAFEGDGIYQNLRFDLQCFLNGLPKMKNEAATFEKLAEISGKLDAYRKAVAALHPCEPVVQTAGKIPEADIVFLDEIFKCNDGVLNALLTALNERKYTNDGHTYPIPTISFFAASNEIPNVLIGLMQPDTRCGYSPCEAAEDLIAGFSAIEAEAKFVQVRLKLCAAAMVSSQQERLQVADGLVQPV